MKSKKLTDSKPPALLKKTCEGFISFFQNPSFQHPFLHLVKPISSLSNYQRATIYLNDYILRFDEALRSLFPLTLKYLSPAVFQQAIKTFIHHTSMNSYLLEDLSFPFFCFIQQKFPHALLATQLDQASTQALKMAPKYFDFNSLNIVNLTLQAHVSLLEIPQNSEEILTLLPLPVPLKPKACMVFHHHDRVCFEYLNEQERGFFKQIASSCSLEALLSLYDSQRLFEMTKKGAYLNWLAPCE